MLSNAFPLKYPQGSYFFCFLQITCVCLQLISFQTHVVLLSCMWISAQHSSEDWASTLPSSSISFEFFFFCVSQIFCLSNNYIAVTIFASQSNLNVNPRRMWTASKFLFESMWILVLRSPTARRNNANAALSNLFSICKSTWASAQVTLTTDYSSHPQLTF